MELRKFDWRDRHLARRALSVKHQLERATRHTEFPALLDLFDALGHQLRVRGFDAGRGMAVRPTFWRMLSALAPGKGRRTVRRIDRGGLPPIDAELLATLLDICGWMARLERPAWSVEAAKCVICGRSPCVPRIKKMEWLRQHVDEHRDRVAGILIGLAAGDQNGGPTEMALRLAHSLLARKCHDPDDVFKRYVDWHRQGSYDTGPVAGRVFDLALEGLPAEVAARQVDAELGGMTAGCNSAHRAGVLAMAPWLSSEHLVAAARLEAGLTHHHPIAADAATAMAIECRDRIMGGGWMIGSKLRLLAPTLHEEVARAVTSGRPVRSANPPTAAGAPRYLSTGGYSPDTLRAAFWFAVHAADPVTALAESRKFAGPANYCPVLVGAMLGARFGASAFDDSLLAHHPAAHAAEIRRVACGLAEQWCFGAANMASTNGAGTEDR